MGKDKKLTPKQERFAKAYVKNGGNGTKAAEAAYPAVKPGRNASVLATQNLQKPDVKAEIDRIMSGINKELADIMDSNQMMQKAIESAFNDMAHEDPKVRNMARKFLADISKDIQNNSPSRQTVHQHLHLDRPKRK